MINNIIPTYDIHIIVHILTKDQICSSKRLYNFILGKIFVLFR